ncbi:MAG: Gfo/Idh/MocA family oxidoreductase [Verrucomicrobia bacterium]|jgi:predicted dehydrogenase|nr:Gfo/Idh/MocA family oxidoreductase [Verrucomicrobiota bacterium]
MSTNFRWGILGTGRIAGEFAEGLQQLEGVELRAVASRKQETADVFAKKFGAMNAHSNYQKLADDPEVDAVYVATPHSLHCENTLLCLEAGKAVICEKPFAVNSQQVAKMIEVARHQNCFLMEAMWMRFIPLIREARRRVAAGAIGDVRMIQADFGFNVPFNPDGRLFDTSLAGGALLDVGIYPLAFSAMFLGEPKDIVSLPAIGESGVDEQSAYLLRHEQGQLSVLSSAVRVETSQSAWVYGTSGRIHFHTHFWKADHMTLYTDGAESKEISMPYSGNGYQFEAQEVMDCIAAGKLESGIMPHSESINLMRTMDRIRDQWGLKYPME